MSPLACFVFAGACASLLSAACGNVLALDVRSLELQPPRAVPSIADDALIQNCTVYKMGVGGNTGYRVVKYDDDTYLKDKPLLLPKVPDFGVLKGVKITACNPTGRAPLVIANDGQEISAQVHCSFIEKPKRCPLGLDINIEEYYVLHL